MRLLIVEDERDMAQVLRKAWRRRITSLASLEKDPFSEFRFLCLNMGNGTKKTD
jgi:hypothetical protein